MNNYGSYVGLWGLSGIMGAEWDYGVSICVVLSYPGAVETESSYNVAVQV